MTPACFSAACVPLFTQAMDAAGGVTVEPPPGAAPGEGYEYMGVAVALEAASAPPALPVMHW